MIKCLNKTNLFFFVFFIFNLTVIFANDWILTEEPSWIEKSFKVEYDGLEDTQSSAIIHRYERQINLEQGLHEYLKLIIEITDRSSITILNEQILTYFPDYQDLKIHKLLIHRGDTVIDKLNNSVMKLWQDTEYNEGNNQNEPYYLSVYIDDLRVGDIIEFSSSISGQNPIFENKYCSRHDLQFDFNLRSYYLKIMYPEEKNINIEYLNTSERLSSEVKEGIVTEELHLTDIQAYHYDSDIPYWYHPYPRINFSEFSSYEEINDLILHLFSNMSDNSIQIKNKVLELTKNLNSNEEKAIAIINYVQNEILYTGTEILLFNPQAASDTFNKKAGGNIDKALLLNVMLNEIGVESYPVLINTGLADTVSDNIPSPINFNHIINLIIVDGKEYWINPTFILQGKKLSNTYISPVIEVLPIREGQKSLVSVTYIEDEHLVSTYELISASDFEDGSATIEIKTEYKNSQADNMRTYMHLYGLIKFQEQLLAMMAETYTEIEVKSDLRYEDDYENNIFTTFETYTIPQFWYYDERRNEYISNILSRNIIYNLHLPKEVNRSDPFTIFYPYSVYQHTELILPEKDWDLTNQSKIIENSSFNFNFNLTYDEINNKCIIKYNYSALDDHVKPEDIKNYINDVNKTYMFSKFTFSNKLIIKRKAAIYVYLIFGIVVLILLFFFIIKFRNKKYITNSKKSL